MLADLWHDARHALGGLLLAVVLLASLVPALRAARVEPMAALRHE